MFLSFRPRHMYKKKRKSKNALYGNASDEILSAHITNAHIKILIIPG